MDKNPFSNRPLPVNPDLVPAPLAAGRSGQRLLVTEDADGQRIDNFLLGHFKGVPKTRVYRMLRTGEVRVDGGRIRPDFRLQAGQWLRLPPVRVPTPAEQSAESSRMQAQRAAEFSGRLSVLLEDQGLLAVHKPPGIAVHGGSGISLGVIEALRATRPPGFLELVHRLDRDTSGVLLLATARKSLLHAHRQLQEGRMRKQYLACVLGDWSADGQLDRPMQEPLCKTVAANGERWVHVHPEGQPSLTKARLLASLQHPDFGPVSLLLCEPLTGRTHQIRVHLMHRGFPILGDLKYGPAQEKTPIMTRLTGAVSGRRMMLHAWKLSFDLPDSGLISRTTRTTITAEPDEDFVTRLHALGLPWPAR
ncbi:MAG: RluA family pseudouridine synthase [Betaproteobacteria bacterium]|nr:RluA family pseudouridine synthase [Betaproteobacteria bacterium]